MDFKIERLLGKYNCEFRQEMESGLHSCQVAHDTVQKTNILKSHKTNSQPHHTPELHIMSQCKGKSEEMKS